ncbi:hypothetical protein [Actinoalloteichus sp. GBA129-24]|uniref:hypothetical protein n=1 Tax=Actinoalloteichus sp. GBA129-24 TaxID=1612551 RepID=UPI0009508783|nr:hypothetical protein [Actinoalloteichus sp. GBA129-24]APU21615.1 hypothetical protein UA75_18125 [Actinoalloteichus sp. GBA129-24]
MQLRSKRVAALAAGAVMAAGIATTFGVSAASPDNSTAGTSRVTYSCGDPSAPRVEDINVTITAPASAAVGDTVTVEAGTLILEGVPFDSPAGSFHTELDITLGGSASGTITATGLSNEETPANTPIPFSGGEVALTLDQAGEASLTPGIIHSVDDGSQCTLVGEADAAATISVGAAQP